MKRIIRKTWIALIAALVVVASACCSIRNRSDIKVVKERISDLKEELSRRETACIYGPPEMLEDYGRQTREMRAELESLEKELQRLRKCK